MNNWTEKSNLPSLNFLECLIVFRQTMGFLVPEHLKCRLCDKVARNCVRIPCCGLDVCRSCGVKFLVQSGEVCCDEKMLCSQLVPRYEMRQLVEDYMKSERDNPLIVEQNPIKFLNKHHLSRKLKKIENLNKIKLLSKCISTMKKLEKIMKQLSSKPTQDVICTGMRIKINTKKKVKAKVKGQSEVISCKMNPFSINTLRESVSESFQRIMYFYDKSES